jgi:hypothetical protein
MKPIPVLLACLLLATPAMAHGPSKGPNGGAHVDAGSYHLEMVAKGTSLTVYLNDKEDKPVEARGHKATGIFVIDGKPQRIELKADSDNRLTGTASLPLPASLKGVVQITLPTGKTVQGKFE